MKVLILEIRQLYRIPLRKIQREVKSIEALESSLEKILMQKDSSPVVHLSNEDKVKVRKIKDYIAENLNKGLSMKGLSQEAGTNVLKLKCGFKLLFGMTVFKFINEERMQKAKELLLESNTPIYTVASMVGYNNPANFSTAFKRQFGCSPGKFRK